MKSIYTAKKHTEWTSVWERENISRWDYLSQVIFNEIKSIAKNFKHKKVVELGSGSGRISKAIFQSGAKVTLLDMDENVLYGSKKEFQNNKANGNFIVGAFPKIPVKDKQFDIVWNAGVIEHFSWEDIKTALLEMARVCKVGGLVITLNPYQKSILHSMGQKFVMKQGIYPYKDEKPIKTLENLILSLGFDIVRKEYSSRFFLLFVGMFKRLALFPRIQNISLKIFWVTSNIMCGLDKSWIGIFIRFLDRLFSKIFGGYLLISTFSPRK